MPYKNILRLIPTIQAAQLASENVKAIKVPKKDASGKGMRANRGKAGCSSTEMVGLGMKNIVGIEVIKLESGLIAGLWNFKE